MFPPLCALWKHFPIAGRLLLTTGLALLVGGALLLQAAAWRDAESARRELAQQLADDLTMLPSLLAETLVVGDYATLEQILVRYSTRSNIAYLRYTNVSDRSVVAANPAVENLAPLLFAAWLSIDDVGGKVPLVIGDRTYGTLEIKLTAQPDINTSWTGTKLHLLILGLASALNFLGIWLVLRSGLAPLRRLDEGAGKLAAGNLSTRLKVVGSPELRRTMTAFNSMAEALQTDAEKARRAESRIRLLAGVFEHAREGITLTDLKGIIVDVNPSFCVITGYSREEVIGKKPSLLSSGQHDSSFFANMWANIKSRGHWQGEVWNCRKDGTLYPEWLSITTLSGDEQEDDHYLGVFSDITDIKAQQDRLEHLAHFDALTHLPNRVLLADRLQMALSQARRNGQTLAVCYLDLDEFKPVNDRFGHQFGDRLLIEIAKRLSQSLRGGDTVARLGGDEFVLLLNDVESVEQCELALTRLLRNAAEPMLIDGHSIQVSASIGVTLFPQDDADADALLRHADQSLYVAKEAGRNRYHLFDVSHDQGIRARRESVAHVDAALNNGELRLYYQPKVDMRLGKVVGAEALIRWQHAERGLLSPAQFLSAIENTRTDVALGEWVIREALCQTQAWRDKGLDIAVSVNISPYHLARKDFVSQLGDFLAAYPQMPRNRLEIEVLETTMLEDIDHVIALIQDCNRLGVDFALDDFGTGYSSLTYLKRLPARTLKIDQTFVRDMLKDKDDLAIVEGIIGLAQAFHRAVIAEGVETVEHGVMLLQMGCDQAQGYGIARPMPAAELPNWVAAWQPDPVWTMAAGVQCAAADLPLLMGEMDHRRWLKELKRLIEDDSVALQASRFDMETCPFADWLATGGAERYGTTDTFRQIDRQHRQLHAVGSELIGLCAAGQCSAAKARFGELETAIDKMADAINALLISTSMQ